MYSMYNLFFFFYLRAADIKILPVYYVPNYYFYFLFTKRFPYCELYYMYYWGMKVRAKDEKWNKKK